MAFLYVYLQFAGYCRDPAAGLQQAQRASVVIAVAACLPWLPAVWTARYRLRVVCFAIAAVAYPVFWTIKMLVSSPQDFIFRWCF